MICTALSVCIRARFASREMEEAEPMQIDWDTLQDSFVQELSRSSIAKASTDEFFRSILPWCVIVRTIRNHGIFRSPTAIAG